MQNIDITPYQVILFIMIMFYVIVSIISNRRKR